MPTNATPPAPATSVLRDSEVRTLRTLIRTAGYGAVLSAIADLAANAAIEERQRTDGPNTYFLAAYERVTGSCARLSNAIGDQI